jgi:tetratricopeptide (TPR) repeat protein
VVNFLPKITDFGLAKLLAGDAAGPTQTGDVMGTPSYMAPEQAAGLTSEVGPAADIYSLGAILYELVTGCPPFNGTTTLATLDLVRSQEPVPPSRLQPRTPRDLETICLKCLRKEPERRYHSAEELADDLQRFLAGQPIQARAVGPAERVGKWVRRRPALAALLVLSVLTLLGLAVGGWWSSAALRAAAQREERQRLQAEASFVQALDAVERLLTRVGAEDLADVPHLAEVRRKLLLDAEHFYQLFLAQRGTDPAVRQLAGRAYSRLGDIHEMLGDYAPAERAYEQAIALLQAAPASSPLPAAQRRELGRALNNLGLLHKKLGRFPQADAALVQALEQRQELADEFTNQPEYAQDLAASYSDRGNVLVRLDGQRDQAVAAYRQALTILEKLPREAAYQQDRARTLNRLGTLLQTSDRAEAERDFRLAIGMQEELHQRDPAAPGYRRDLAHSWNNLAAMLWLGGNARQAEQTYRKALPLLTSLTADFHTAPVYRHELATLHNNLGMVLEDLGDLPRAQEAYSAALALRRQLVDAAPRVPDYQHKLAVVYLSLGSVREKQHQPHEAEAAYRQARAVLEKLLAGNARGQAVYQSELGTVLNALADLLFKRSHLAEAGQYLDLRLRLASGQPLDALGVLVRARAALVEARNCLAQAVVCQRAALDADQQNANYRRFLHDHYLALALVQLRLGNPDAAARAAGELPVLFPDEPDSYVTGAEVLARCVLLAAGDPLRVESFGRQAVQLLRQALAKGLQNVEKLKVHHFDSLRRRPDFNKLLADLEKAKV